MKIGVADYEGEQEVVPGPREGQQQGDEKARCGRRQHDFHDYRKQRSIRDGNNKGEFVTVSVLIDLCLYLCTFVEKVKL